MAFFYKPSTTCNNVVEKEFYRDGAPCIIDGVDVLNELCPVSKKTGLRENPLSLIRKLVTDPAKQALLAAFVQELPVDNSQANLDELSKFEFCPQRLIVGTPAENQVMLDHLNSVIDLLTDSQKAQRASQVVEKLDSGSVDKEIIDNA